jgi:hypothetical protein
MKIAGVQMDVTIGEVDQNVQRMIDRLRETRAAGAELTIFPECAATGYCFDSLDEARPYAESIPGPITERMAAACAELGGFAVFGMLEVEGESVFNAAVLVGAEGVRVTDELAARSRMRGRARHCDSCDGECRLLRGGQSCGNRAWLRVYRAQPYLCAER